MPTHGWRFWTTITSYPDALVCLYKSLPDLVPRAAPNALELKRLAQAWYRCARYVVGRFLPRRHGERGNVISELWLFHPNWWRQNFRDNGFSVIRDEPMRLFYTGNMLLGALLGTAKRERVAGVLGSACHLFKVSPTKGSDGALLISTDIGK
jgi:hypothetical protein